MALTDKEWETIDSAFYNIDPTHDIGSALRDCFALGCYVHLKGHHSSGKKAIWSALQAVKLHKTNKVIYSKLLKEIEAMKLYLSTKFEHILKYLTCYDK